MTHVEIFVTRFALRRCVLSREGGMTNMTNFGSMIACSATQAWHESDTHMPCRIVRFARLHEVRSA